MKSAEDIVAQLEAIQSSPDFVERSREIAQGWHSEAGVNVRISMEGVLRFMEKHPDLDFGNPGPLVYRLESLSTELYVPSLLASLARTPTTHTVWMLNRLINGLKGAWRDGLIEDMRAISKRTDISAAVQAEAREFVERLDGEKTRE